MDTLTGVILSNSTVTSLILHKSTLTACTLRDLTIHDSTISGSTLTNCRIHASVLKCTCNIEGSTLYKCKIYGTKGIEGCAFQDCELMSDACTLKKIPVGVRKMIFELCLERKSEEKGCALIAALRGQGEIYQDALEVFTKGNSFQFKEGDKEFLNVMPYGIVSTIHKLTIHVSSINGIWDLDFSGTKHIKGAFKSCKMLTEVEIAFGDLPAADVSYFLYDWVYAVMVECTTLTSLTTTGKLPHKCRKIEVLAKESEQVEQSLGSVEEVSIRLGIDATPFYLERIGSIQLRGQHKGWAWKAESGKTLTWKKG